MRLITLTLAFILYLSPVISNEQSLPKLDNENINQILKELKKNPKANQIANKENKFNFNSLKPFLHIIVIGILIIIWLSNRKKEEKTIDILFFRE